MAAAEASARHLGFQHLIEEQNEAVVSFALGKDVLVLLPILVLFIVTVDF